MQIPNPPLKLLRAGNTLPAGLGKSTIIADMDFETYSPAGFVWDETLNKWKPPQGASVKGLPTVGAAAYSEHPDAEVLCLAYDLKDGLLARYWIPGQPTVAYGIDNKLPYDLLQYIIYGGLIEAWNVTFEKWVWDNICIPKYGFPPLPQNQLRCAMAKSRAFALPGRLKEIGTALNLTQQKDKNGERLIKLFCIPRDPTIKDKSIRRMPDFKDPEFAALSQYCLQDIATEAEASSRIPDLSPQELEIWQCDQAINRRGVQIDIESINSCIQIIEQAYAKYNQELKLLTGGTVNKASEVAKILKWLRDNDNDPLYLDNLTDDTLNNILGLSTITPSQRRVLEIRQMLGSASVKKLYAMKNQATKAGRIHDLFIYHSARTGRAAGAGPQPQNLPNSGPEVYQCEKCNRANVGNWNCPWCFTEGLNILSFKEWNHNAVENALEIAKHGNLDLMEYYFSNAIATISGCLRGMFSAKPGYELISSDYSAIEAVVAAALSGEEWRLEVFRTHGMIYEMSASKITGIPFEEFIEHKQRTGQHHPMRKKIGKIAELASGFGGWIDSWKNFGADEFYSDDEIQKHVLAWRAASPKIVEMWGGHKRNWQDELYGLEGAAILAVQNPGNEYNYHGLTFQVHEDILYFKLLSGRYLVYHKPQVRNTTRKTRKGNIIDILELSFAGWNTNPMVGNVGWTRMVTYGPKLFENAVQAHARDILMYALVNLEKAGYPVVLHVHDEATAEVPKGFGSLEEYERIMSTMPPFAANWPIRANGGWRGNRYRK